MVTIMNLLLYIHAGNLDYFTLTPGMFGGDQVSLVSPDFRGCAVFTVIGDTMPEGNEMLELRLVADNPNALVNGNFIYDPNVTRIIIEDDDTITPSATPVPSPSPTDPTPPPTAVVASPSPCKPMQI